MVTNVTSLGRNGLYDWLIQRVSAVVMLAYMLFLAWAVMTTPDMQFADWRGLFAGTGMKIFSLVALLSLCAHAWIGMWTVSTDYLTPRFVGGSATALRLLFQMACLLVLIVYFIWCVRILWSI